VPTENVFARINFEGDAIALFKMSTTQWRTFNAHDHDERRNHNLLEGLGRGQPVVFSHGWPLSADAWEDQMVFLASHGFRTIAHDRRGHGRSSQPWDGNDMNTYADDLAALTEALDLKDAIHVGHSAEVERWSAISAATAQSGLPKRC